MPLPLRIDEAALRAASRAYPKPTNFRPSYGTAGFRANADLLASTVFRCGLLAAARALLLGAHTGLMITASHNPAEDNGVKMVEPDGGMMPQSFEPVAVELANCEDEDQLVTVLRDRVFAAEQLSPGSDVQHITVILGHDTRPSAEPLLAAALAGVKALNVHAAPCGLLTTPQLHFLVHLANTQQRQQPKPASPPLQAYYDTICGAFLELAKQTPGKDTESSGSSRSETVYVDCANGVGAAKLQQLVPLLQDVGLRLELLNTGAGRLNHLCGADFVQKDRMVPTEFERVPAGARCCSIDGDADRLVYFSPEPPCTPAPAEHGGEGDGSSSGKGGGGGSGGISLLDGDKVAILAAVFIRDLMDQLPAELLQGVQVCCVQTAYANGAATAYLRDVLQLPVTCTPTGVKYLHEAAHGADLGIYFEANGHGTVLFSKQLLQRLREAGNVPAAKELLLLSRLINQTVGDAISGILLVELILRRKGWGLAQWQALYADLPSRQLKLKVADRTCITTTGAERVCVTPKGLQGDIDELVAQYPNGRAFCRPSGTEDAVRVYAEAATQQQADELATRVAQAVYDKAGGVGSRP